MAFKVILIAGATGQLGQAVVTAFLEKKKFEVRIIVREAAKENKKSLLNELTSKGAKLITGDVNSLDVKELAKLLHGVDVVISCLSADAVVAGQLNLLNASKEAGVKRFIPSEFGVDAIAVPKDLPNGRYLKLGIGAIWDAKLVVQKALKESGLEYTLIFSGLFQEMLYSSFLGFDILNRTALQLGDGSVKVTITSIADIAKHLPEIIDNPSSKNASVYISGETLTWSQILETLENGLGQTFEKKLVTVEELEKDIEANQGNFFLMLGKQIILTIFLGLLDLKHSSNSDYPSIKQRQLKEWVAELSKQKQA